MNGWSTIGAMSEFKYFGCVLDESDANVPECRRKVASERRVASAIRSLVSVRGIQLECARVLHDALLMPVLMYDSKQCFGKRRRDLELELYRWTTSEKGLVLGVWIESRMHGYGSYAE